MQRLGRDMFNPLAAYQGHPGVPSLPPLSAALSGAAVSSGSCMSANVAVCKFRAARNRMQQQRVWQCPIPLASVSSRVCSRIHDRHRLCSRGEHGADEHKHGHGDGAHTPAAAAARA